MEIITHPDICRAQLLGAVKHTNDLVGRDKRGIHGNYAVIDLAGRCWQKVGAQNSKRNSAIRWNDAWCYGVHINRVLVEERDLIGREIHSIIAHLDCDNTRIVLGCRAIDEAAGNAHSWHFNLAKAATQLSCCAKTCSGHNQYGTTGSRPVGRRDVRDSRLGSERVHGMRV